jgi:signal transduction histidine kinase
VGSIAEPIREPVVDASGLSTDVDMLATVAHELRSPLTSLRITLDLLGGQFDELGARDRQELVRRARRMAVWAEGVIDNVISLALLDTGRLRVIRGPVDLLEAVELTRELIAPVLSARRQNLKVTSAVPSPVAIGDRQLVERVILNLLTNASRYGAEGDDIRIQFTEERSRIRVRVIDHGPGVDRGERERIFGRYVRGSSAARAGLGLGLGLAVVRELVALQGGRVGVRSTARGGATFWFTLPSSPGVGRTD